MYYFIVNPKSRSGYGYRIWETIEQELKNRNITYQKYFTHYEYHAIKIASKICDKAKEHITIVVVGGDGTFNEVINGIKEPIRITLGYIPSGSSNDLARSLHIPTDPIAALHVILTKGKISAFDLGRITIPNKKKGRYFAVSTGIGFDASICNEALHSNIKRLLNKFHIGKLSYVTIALKQLLQYEPLHGTVIIDGYDRIELNDIFFIACMNQPCEGGGFYMAPHANPGDGMLNICIIHGISKWYGCLYVLPMILLKKQKYAKGVKIIKCRSIEIRTSKKAITHTDGEFFNRGKHYKVQCADNQIRIIHP